MTYLNNFYFVLFTYINFSNNVLLFSFLFNVANVFIIYDYTKNYKVDCKGKVEIILCMLVEENK